VYFWRVRFGVAAVFVVCSMASFGACSAQTSAPSYYDEPIETDARAPTDAACGLGVALSLPSGCRSTWACVEAGVVALTCQASDAGYRCACTGEATDGGTFFDVDAEACVDGGASSSLARVTCGWSVP